MMLNSIWGSKFGLSTVINNFLQHDVNLHVLSLLANQIAQRPRLVPMLPVGSGPYGPIHTMLLVVPNPFQIH